MDFILLQLLQIFKWDELLFGKEDAAFLAEVALRSTCTFIVTLLSLRLLGKRGVTQLSVFELVVILTLGSAAGDAMFYKDVGLLHSFMVFVMVVVLYNISTYLMGKSERVEKFLEGTETYIIKNGKFEMDAFKKQIAFDEFFTRLRQSSVSHLGQVATAILENNGQLSIFFFEDDHIKYGLPILPDEYAEQIQTIKIQGIYSCAYCGNTEELGSGHYSCKFCKHDKWVKSINNRRIV